MAFGRWGYTPAYLLLITFGQIHPMQSSVIANTIANGTRLLFILYFAYLLIRIAQGKMTLIHAGFLAYFSQLLLGTTFRIWYPIWLIPFAALGMNSRTYWRTFLFSLTAELSILIYLIVWRWQLKEWDWGLNGPLKPYWNFWIIATSLTVPWLFGIPILGPLLQKRRDSQRFDETLWI